MLNVDVARRMIKSLNECENVNEYYKDEITILEDFVDEVERLLQYNAIKQTPALFKGGK